MQCLSYWSTDIVTSNKAINSKFEMRKMGRTIDFVKMYCNWAEKCLADDGKWEELAFFKLGIDLGVRQKELLSIRWDQIDFPYVKDVKILKASSAPRYYLPKEISIFTMLTLNELRTDRELVFTKDAIKMIASIRESIGDNLFHGHTLRKFSAILRSFNFDEE